MEAKHPRDLPKLVEAMRKLNIEDPNLIITINQESGETLMAGMGVLRQGTAVAPHGPDGSYTFDYDL